MRGPIAYLTGEYPKVSHTFIEREIAGLRALGWEIAACTIRRAPARDVVGPAQEAEARQTFCVLEAAKSPRRLLAAHWRMFSRAPRAYRQAAALAFRTTPEGIRSALWQFFYFLEAAVLADHLLTVGARHLHNHFADSSCNVAMLAATMVELPFSFTPHGPSVFYEAHKWRLDEKTARAAFVVNISHFARSQMMYFSDPQNWGKLPIVHCGVRPAEYGTASHAPGKQVMFVGRLDPVKGVPLLIEAFAALSSKHPDARLDILGDGPARGTCMAQVAAAGLTDRVTFHGYRTSDEVTEALNGADVLVLPSFAEGVPVVLMEALAARVPVIASRVAGVSELVEDGENGFTIPAGDVVTLAARLDELLSDAELRTRLGNAGRAKVEAEFDLDAEVAWLSRLFEGSLSGQRPENLRP